MQVIILINGRLLEHKELSSVPFVGEVVNIRGVDLVVHKSSISKTPSINVDLRVLNLVPITRCLNESR